MIPQEKQTVPYKSTPSNTQFDCCGSNHVVEDTRLYHTRFGVV
jgi:hypothetical protein